VQTSSGVFAEREVVASSAHGGRVQVYSGLKAGETVVSSGAFKLRSGATILVRNDMAPDVKADPKPADN